MIKSKKQLKNLTEKQLDQYLKENLKVEQLVSLYVVLDEKKYSETIEVQRLLKVYERAVKGEQIFSSAVPEMLEKIKKKVLKDIPLSKE